MKTAILSVLLLIPVAAFANDESSVREHANEMFSKCDHDGDGKISKDEYQKEKMELFSKYDTNSDGYLSKDEHEKMAVDMHDKLMSSHKK